MIYSKHGVSTIVKMQNEKDKYESAKSLLATLGIVPTSNKNYGLYIMLYHAGYYWSDNLLMWNKWGAEEFVKPDMDEHPSEEQPDSYNDDFDPLSPLRMGT